jgi:hypothetical protein
MRRQADPVLLGPGAALTACVVVPFTCVLGALLIVGGAVALPLACCLSVPCFLCLPCAMCCCPPEVDATTTTYSGPGYRYFYAVHRYDDADEHFVGASRGKTSSVVITEIEDEQPDASSSLKKDA